jgi:subtilisin family serine protease
VAVLDGPVDLGHPCFAGANLTPLATLAGGCATDGAMSRHGTHVASVIFGRTDVPVPGLAPGPIKYYYDIITSFLIYVIFEVDE